MRAAGRWLRAGVLSSHCAPHRAGLSGDCWRRASARRPSSGPARPSPGLPPSQPLASQAMENATESRAAWSAPIRCLSLTDVNMKFSCHCENSHQSAHQPWASQLPASIWAQGASQQSPCGSAEQAWVSGSPACSLPTVAPGDLSQVTWACPRESRGGQTRKPQPLRGRRSRGRCWEGELLLACCVQPRARCGRQP